MSAFQHKKNLWEYYAQMDKKKYENKTSPMVGMIDKKYIVI